MKNNIRKEVLLSIGMFSLVAAIFLDRFGPNIGLIDFLVGFFTALSATLNLSYLIKLRLERTSNTKL
jgi:hypothetical protein